MLYLKKLRENGGGEWEQIKVDPDQKSAEDWVREFYSVSGWAVSTQEEFEAQIAPEVAEESLEGVGVSEEDSEETAE